jgi:uncharacterized protein
LLLKFKMISFKEHEDGVAALADSNLIGKKFEEGVLVLDVNEKFYKGEDVSKEKIVKVLTEYSNINLVGEQVIKIAVEEGFISQQDVKTIQGVPHVQIYSISER